MLTKIKNLLGLSKAKLVENKQLPYKAFEKELLASGLVAENWHTQLPLMYASLSRDALDALKLKAPAIVSETVSDAETILAHQFDFLGSGNFVPVNKDKKSRTGYQPINWNLDPVRNLEFPKNIHYKEWELYSMRPGNADVKYPWELGRCQHLPLLGQAYLLTGESRFSLEILDQIQDFMEENPVGYAVNWTCTMDVAIRALNWALALSQISKSPGSDDRIKQSFYYLYLHGDFIFNNLENNYEVTSNHFLSNVVGLYYLSVLFESLSVGKTWYDFCRESLETEIKVQILEDGADYESSVPYHRLVTELFLGASWLSVCNKRPLSNEYNAVLKNMLDFLEGTLRPDGLMPQIGDADDGRLHILSDFGSWKPQDARHIFGPAGCMFGVEAWKSLSGLTGLWESSWWGMEESCKNWPNETELAGLPVNRTAVFRDAGLIIAREDTNYLLISNSIVGTKGFGNHKHNDLLSFEYFYRGAPFIVDPGSYVYTSDFDARNRYRSVNAHNTLCIDNEEQNETNPEWIFRLFESANPVHENISEGGEILTYTGSHTGYDRVLDGCLHRRSFIFQKKTGELVIKDFLKGNDTCQLSWNFTLAPGVDINYENDSKIILISNQQKINLIYPEGFQMSVKETGYSPSYGVEKACKALKFESTRALSSIGNEWEFIFQSA